MLRASRSFCSAILSADLKAKFATTQFQNATEMLAVYTQLLQPARDLKSTMQQVKDENVQLDFDINQNKALDDRQKAAKSEQLAKNQAQVEKIAAELEAVSKTLDAQVFEKALESLAQDMPEGVFSIAEQVGSEMNEFKIISSPSMARSLRKIYFGDGEGDNSEVLFRTVERPASMFVVHGDVSEMLKKLPELFEERGTTVFDQRMLDKSKLETGNVDDNERKLMAQLEAQK
jgi:hypothetical protein|uniref:Uncharacterized protein n=2 Tax=Eutreptiella gymnastica TaxID=73025 RepID=A0A7S4LHL5_9EUGL|mmetsp:Transcript_64677/g.107188  ORF Transcript_64677/g.107188 Transcript_64677/m.107188 type:complete len:232 (+) Transcript_64677:54-749(+)|eukprot:CAMPEP_0174300358 /NCGR_PEP_ID=MMETSP0809-20121228/58419_1 /TAXON_ID=73025 ORGANISM="Eutreptiella gymnastica-like, Strain CCMP1594" /NCGR_SAMPLE_ID=MMETSP0809 /ASSEMBLY_ACC=CAM_ASM_000658 /LENGTH=231 /DNA_ID=CAMNT_0015405929 /DNA_START=58 /DNA_END=753 /DNA_ORIENTATION=-